MSAEKQMTTQEVFDNWSTYLPSVDRPDFLKQLRSLSAPALAGPCNWCDPSFSCFNGSESCHKQPAPASAPEGVVLVPREAFDWLMGLGDGFEPPKDYKLIAGMLPKYWWRGEFCKRAGLDRSATLAAAGKGEK